LKSVFIIAIVAVAMIGMILPNVYANDFKIETKCDEQNLIISLVDQDGEIVQNVVVRTADGIRGTSNTFDEFSSDENGEVSIDFSENTGYVYISKGGFNDKKMDVKTCEGNEIPSWIKMNAQWWIEEKIDENSFLEGMRYLIKENIIKIPENIDGDRNSVTYETGQKIPMWVKTTVEWWASDITNDETFLQGMQFLVVNKIIDLSEDRIIESGTMFVDSSNSDNSGIISQSSKEQSFETSECTGEFPYRWSDGNCWNLPEDYEMQIELICPDGYPYVWSDGNCYSVPECNSNYPYRGSDGGCYNMQECPSDYQYRWNDGQCYNMQECTGEFPYRWDDNQCYNLPQDYEEQLECKGEFPFRWSDGGCYNMQECPSDYQYRWNDGQCYNMQECTGEFPYRWDNGICYNVPPPLSCVDNHAYDTGYGYCCPNNMYTTGNGMCEFIQACPAGYWETNYGDCCPDGTFDPGDGSCRYP